MKIIPYNELTEDFYCCGVFEKAPLVRTILEEVRTEGDRAVQVYTNMFDGVAVEQLEIPDDEREAANRILEPKTKEAIEQAKNNIERFARKQLEQFRDFEYEVTEGVFSGQQVVPIERVGIYAPGGRYPLVSTILMCGVPAQIAGVKELVVCSPPTFRGTIHPLIIATADFIGIQEIFRVGGAQAIAAMAYGTETIRPVSKIVGPGNKYVSHAKKEVFGTVGVDFIAGPTEILIIADDSAEASIIASDLLAQAEHDTNASCILVSLSASLADMVEQELQQQVGALKTASVARQSLEKNGYIIMVSNQKEAVEIANRKAPEHLELHVHEPDRYINQLRNYGSLFIGTYASETLGDYSSGLNHTLPTSGGARYTGGLSVRDFLKLQTTLRVEEKGFMTIGPVAQHFGEIEGMDAHAASINLRMKKLKSG